MFKALKDHPIHPAFLLALNTQNPIIALVGLSGSGKTLTLRQLALKTGAILWDFAAFETANMPRGKVLASQTRSSFDLTEGLFLLDNATNGMDLEQGCDLVTHLRDRAIATGRKVILATQSPDALVPLLIDAVVVCVMDEDERFHAQLLSSHEEAGQWCPSPLSTGEFWATVGSDWVAHCTL